MGFLNKLFGKSDQETATRPGQESGAAVSTPEAPSMATASAPEPGVQLKEERPLRIKERLEAGEGLVLVDVREEPEREICRIESALHIPLAEIPSRHEELPKDKPIVLHCHHGMRSAMAGYELLNAGFTDVTNMTGGIHAWALEVEPDMRQY